MGVYRDRVLPHLIDRVCGSRAMRPWRDEVTDGLAGRVVEVGFGSGLNQPHYPDDIEVVLAVEPAAAARRLAERRTGAGTVPVEHVGLDGQALPLDDASCDAALCTFTLCTVPDPALVLAELHRVLRPGGRFHFLEHGLAPEPSVAAWQRRIEPWQKRLADGCHLTRDATALVEEAGFRLERHRQAYARGPKPWSWFTVGTAVRPADG
jgi:ubiquinone/menaquinone biosynthesis C-methylase UbiE